jgi:hypothetical protein
MPLTEWKDVKDGSVTVLQNMVLGYVTKKNNDGTTLPEYKTRLLIKPVVFTPEFDCVNSKYLRSSIPGPGGTKISSAETEGKAMDIIDSFLNQPVAMLILQSIQG